MSSGATAETVAAWMLDELQGHAGYLAQDDAAAQIERKFGDAFVHVNDGGNLSIAVPVLKAFRKLTENTIVWDRSERAWRTRESHDPKMRRQAD